MERGAHLVPTFQGADHGMEGRAHLVPTFHVA